jgi:hypothetical protein
MFGYFDLNQRTESVLKNKTGAKGMLGGLDEVTKPEAKHLSLWRQVLMYFGYWSALL